jgi:hypothetical protein
VVDAVLQHTAREVLMAKDQRRLEYQPVTLDTLMQIEPDEYKRLGDCTEEELMRAALLRMARLEEEAQQEINKMTTAPNE